MQTHDTLGTRDTAFYLARTPRPAGRAAEHSRFAHAPCPGRTAQAAGKRPAAVVPRGRPSPPPHRPSGRRHPVLTGAIRFPPSPKERRQCGESRPHRPRPAPPVLPRASAMDSQQGPRTPAALRRGVRKIDRDHPRPAPVNGPAASAHTRSPPD